MRGRQVVDALPPRWRPVTVRAALAGVDVVVLVVAYALAVMVRFDGAAPSNLRPLLLAAGMVTVVTRFTCLRLYGVQRFSWRHTSLHEALQVFAAMAIATVALLLLDLSLRVTQALGTPMLMPLGVLAADHVLAFLALIGVRAGRRILVDESRARSFAEHRVEAVPTVLIGAGPAGVSVARELTARPDMGIRAVGFIDDDPGLVGRTVQGLPVLGTTEQLAQVAAEQVVEQAIITIASATGEDMRRVLAQCDDANLKTKIIPPVSEIVGGRITLSRIRDVRVEDLLGRTPVTLDADRIAAFVTGRVVMVTGAGGSIGSELCRQIIQFSPAQLVLVEQAENNLFQIFEELRTETAGHDALTPVVADVCDRSRMAQVMRDHRPSAVFHAAAHKHVPMMEANPGEAVKNNIGGTRVVAELAHDVGAEYFVLISTDKAVNPSSVMGASKRVAEMYVQALARTSETKFVTVRFGNVLGSSGSVVPTFQRQLEAGEPLTVTHPDMRRYFMTIPEASQLVLQAASMGAGGEIFVLDMGEPVKVVDLARAMIRLAGLRPDEAKIVITGPRPGEKLYEELHLDEEGASQTRHPKILIGKSTAPETAAVAAAINKLMVLAEDGQDAAVVEHLEVVVPSYAPSRASAELSFSERRIGDPAPDAAVGRR